MMAFMNGRMAGNPNLSSTITVIGRFNKPNRQLPNSPFTTTVVQGKIQDAVLAYVNEEEREKYIFQQYFDLWKDLMLSLKDSDSRYSAVVPDISNQWVFDETVYLQMKIFKLTLKKILLDEKIGLIVIKRCKLLYKLFSISY